MEIAVSSLDVAEAVSMKVCKKCRVELPLGAFEHIRVRESDTVKYHHSCRKCNNVTPSDEEIRRRIDSWPAEKTCTGCGETKTTSSFGMNNVGRKAGTLRPRCRGCDVARSQKWNQDNRDKFNNNCTTYYYRHREKLLSEPYVKRRLELGKEWFKKNPYSITKSAADRRAAKRSAIPSWVDNAKIRDIYLESHRLSAETGVKHVVDHIIPLRSYYVCGFHVHDNLRSLDLHENAKKHNSWWPDMWEVTSELRKIAKEFKKQNA